MGQKLPDDQMQLYRRLDEILFYVWDPASISTCDWPRDEYHAYLPQVFKMLMEREDPKKIQEYLLKVESEDMGLSRWFGTQKKIEKLVLLMCAVRDSIIEKNLNEKTEQGGAANPLQPSASGDC